MRVLLGVDGSQSSDRAASLVANLAWPVGSTIDVLTAYPGSVDRVENVGMAPSADLAQERENAVKVAAQALVADAARKFAAADVTVETRVVRDRASKAILDEAARFAYPHRHAVRCRLDRGADLLPAVRADGRWRAARLSPRHAW